MEIIKGVSMEIARGEFAVFVGPSGCGKSTLLRMIAGLEETSAGQIAIGTRDVTDEEPAKRGVAMVFQSYALYPHLNVFDNMAFSLQLARRPKAEIGEKVRAAATILRLTDQLSKKPAELSGGQRQRVAIGRAIVRAPEVFLFDEPLSNLDAELRVQMRLELSRLHRRLGATMIYVTHDQVEAMTLADKIFVLRDGMLQQSGRPLDLYDDPDNRFVAGFIGSPSMNFLDGKVSKTAEGRVRITLTGEKETLEAAVKRTDPRWQPGHRRHKAGASGNRIGAIWRLCSEDRRSGGTRRCLLSLWADNFRRSRRLRAARGTRRSPGNNPRSDRFARQGPGLRQNRRALALARINLTTMGVR